MKERTLFGDIEVFDVDEHWQGMPEYNNVFEPDPAVTALFRFRTEEDFLEFKDLVQEHIFNGERVFDGMQKVDAKTTWYPHLQRASRYRYVDQEGGAE